MVWSTLPEPVGGRLGVITKPLFALAERLLRLLAAADIPEVHDEGAHARLPEQIRHRVLGPEPRSVLMLNEPLAREDAVLADQCCGKLVPGVFELVGMDKIETVAADQFSRRIPQHPLDRRAGVKDAVITVQEQHHIEGVLDQGAKTLCAFPNRLFCALALGDVFARDEHDHVAVRPLDSLGAFAYPQRRAVLADLLGLPRVQLAGPFQA